MVQWLRLCAPDAGAWVGELVSDWIQHAATKARCSQMNKY